MVVGFYFLTLLLWCLYFIPRRPSASLLRAGHLPQSLCWVARGGCSFFIHCFHFQGWDKERKVPLFFFTPGAATSALITSKVLFSCWDLVFAVACFPFLFRTGGHSGQVLWGSAVMLSLSMVGGFICLVPGHCFPWTVSFLMFGPAVLSRNQPTFGPHIASR